MTASRVLAVLSFAALMTLLASMPSCTEEPIVLATLPTNDAGAPVTPARCADKDCPANSFCSKTTCSDATGTCEQETVCDGQPESLVCGCDSITYYNDCLRKAAGIAASTQGPCGGNQNANINFCTADGTLACPDPTTQVCAFLIQTKGPCPPPFGTCWVIPAACPATPEGTDRWNACDQSDQTDHCLDTCNAIQTGKEFRHASECPAPPGG